jgi:hypothetical protein
MQQVNLLSGELLPKREPLVARQFVIVWGCLALLLAAITSWHSMSLWGLQSDLVSTQSELDKLTRTNAIQRAQSVDPEVLREQVSQLHDQQLAQKQLMNWLRTESESAGFSPYMAALARARVEGLWFDEFRIAHNPLRYLTLKGATVDALHVPAMLQNLASEKQFAGQRFEQIELISSPDEDVIEFAIVSPQVDVSG